MTGRQRLTLPALRQPAQRELSAPLLPARARRPTAILACCCLVLVVVLGVVFAHQTRGEGIDQPVDSWIMGLHIPLAVLSRVSQLGGVPATAAMALILVVGCLVARRVSGAVLAVTGLAAASAITERVVKPTVDRTITFHHYVSYPSGHTTGVFALTTALAVVLLSTRTWQRRRAVTVAVVALAVLVSCAVGAAMIALEFHYFTDTVAGAAVGTGTTIAVAFLLDLDVSRRFLGRLGR